MMNKMMTSFKHLSGTNKLLTFESFSEKKLNSLKIINEFYFSDMQKALAESPMAMQSVSSPCLFGLKPHEEVHDNFSAIFFMLVSSLIQSFVNLITKVLLRDYPEIGTTTANFFRGLIMMIISLIYFRLRDIDLIHNLKKDPYKTKLLFLRCFFGASSHIFLYESNKYMRISSAAVIFSTYPIIASLISVLYLKVKVSGFQVFTYLACFISVILIAKPAFIFPTNDKVEDTSFGIFLAFMSAILNGIGTLINKQIAFDFDVTLSTFGYGFLFSLDSMLLGISSGSFLYGVNIFDYSFFLIFLLSVFYFYSLIYFVLALNIGDPIKSLPFTYIGIVLNILYNFFLFGGKIDFLDIFGSGTIITVNVLNNIMQLK